MVGSNSEGTGIFALDRCEQVDLLCIPSPPGRDLGSTSFVAATRYCERRRALLVWDPPWSWSSASGALLGVRTSAQSSRNALTYFPRVRPRGDLGRYDEGMPASGAVAGLIARCDRHGVWHSLPDEETTLKGNLVPVCEVDAAQAVALQRAGINAFVRSQPGVATLHGNVSFAALTSAESCWRTLSVVRLTSFVLRSIERYTRWVFSAERSDELGSDLERQVWLFLARLQQRAALVGPDSRARILRPLAEAARRLGRAAERRCDHAAGRLRAREAERVRDLRLPFPRDDDDHRGRAGRERGAPLRLTRRRCASRSRM